MTAPPSLLHTFIQDLVGRESSELGPLQPTKLGTVSKYTHKVQEQQLSTLHRTIPSGIFASVLGITALLVAMWGNAPKSHLLIWTFAMIVIVMPQAVSYFYHLRVVRRDGINAITPLLVLLPFLIEGLAWGASAMYISILQPILYQGILLFMIALVAISAALFFPVYLPALYIFEIPLLMLVSVTLFMQGSDLHTRLGFATLLVLGAILYLGRNFNRALTAAIITNLANEDLVVELRVQKESAEKANLAKTRFLASASHDLRQPLQTVGLLTGIMNDRVTADSDRMVTQKALAAVHSMEGLLNGLLDISKLDAGIVIPNITEFPVQSILDSLFTTFSEPAGQNGLRLVIRPSELWVRSDATILERILNNFIANALRYTLEGGVLLGCRKHGNHLCIQIWDTGIGIADGHLDDIFLEFFQIGNPERDRTKGLGLGLSIVRRSAELLGHPLYVSSILGKGTCFAVEVPLAEPQISLSSASDGESASEGDVIFGRFILIIDDEQDVRFALGAVFEQWGCEVLCAGSSDEAISHLEGSLRIPDLLICDYRLRDNKNGLMAISAIRESLDADMPAVIVTGDIAASDIQRVSELRLPLLHKPVKAEHLRRIVTELLRSASKEECA